MSEKLHEVMFSELPIGAKFRISLGRSQIGARIYEKTGAHKAKCPSFDYNMDIDEKVFFIPSSG